ncbi:tryptophan--tRNA ligase [Candidatus Cytomitobacter primus]|uniref:Tryptophan--tRNA ligase n=2 Tax=Candidatus Cytomitobacter primus TaxID=2066024 RepID=A0A5C0UFS3_9PROT|nr:tryptophan--tRNA ligase [Candidatus Cytomitobacter primus]
MLMSIILTGDRPTGKLHLGHYVGSLKSRVELQEKHEQYVMIADLQAMTDNNADIISTNILEVMKDYISIGLNPDKTTFLLQSAIPELTELTFYYMNLVTLGRLERNPTVKTEIQQKNYENSLPMGFLCYPVSQAADITIFQADFVPVGNDQIPMIEQTNEIVRKFSATYGEGIVKEAKAVLSNTQRLVGIDGKAKASKSLGNAIILSDSEEEIRRKVFEMYTDPNHIHVSDPGKVEGNVVFEYLDAFYEDKNHLEDLKAHYAKGGLGDVKLKKLLNQTLQDFIAPIRERRNALNDADMKNILLSGTKKAREVAVRTMKNVRSAMKINFFEQH